MLRAQGWLKSGALPKDFSVLASSLSLACCLSVPFCLTAGLIQSGCKVCAQGDGDCDAYAEVPACAVCRDRGGGRGVVLCGWSNPAWRCDVEG
jgi:hypothetical protein